MLAYLFRKHPVWRDCRIRVFHIVDSLTKQEAEADLGAVSLTIQEWLKHHRLDDFISEVQVINVCQCHIELANDAGGQVEFEGVEWANQASVKVSHAGETLRRTLALSDFTNKSSMSLGVGDAIGSPGAVANMHRSLTRGSAGKVVSSYIRVVGSNLHRIRSHTLQNYVGGVCKSPACSENISRIRVVNEQMVLHSSDAGVVITNLFDVPEGEGSLAYMQLVELFCADLKRVLLIRGNVVDETPVVELSIALGDVNGEARPRSSLCDSKWVLMPVYILEEFQRVKADSNTLTTAKTPDLDEDADARSASKNNLAERQFLYLDEIRNLRTPQDVSIDLNHMAVGPERVGGGTIISTATASSKTYGSYDFKEYLQAHCVVDMYNDVFVSSNYSLFSDWICRLVAQGERTTTFPSYPGVKFMTRDAVYHLHTFLQQYHIADFRDQQGFLDLLQEVSEGMELMTLDDEHLDDYVPVATVQSFLVNFARSYVSLLKEQMVS
ncbi:hypothetical protein FOZ60_006906 [Perkinsus olseni]|uniref:Uncharacterized protein n=1 Tax=Perkinsus olseni TaxID=32597 RepID=A0A7J6NMK8_PEROL|nr:hypothetical protein FOZ60_006906 [Perkinsus olseni]